MKTNLKTLKLYHNQSGSIRIALTYEGQPKDYETFWVIGKNEIPYVIRRLQGNEPTSYLIDDLSYHLKFGTDGILCHELSDNKVIRHYVTFPGKILEDAIVELDARPYQDDYKRESENILTVDPSVIARAAFENHNRSKIIYQDDEVRLAIIRLLGDPQTKDYFRRQFQSIVRQSGENYRPYHISFDGYNERTRKYPSFYFYFERGYNGGIINHSRDELTPDYSIHT